MRNLTTAILVSLLGVVLIGLAHIKMDKNNMLTTFNSFDSKAQSLEINDRYLRDVYDFHRTEPTFKRRVVTSSLIYAIHKLTNWTIGSCFLFVQFLSFFFCGVLLFYTAKELGSSLVQSILSCLCFFLSYSVLMAFFITNYTYDEPLQYLFLLASILTFLSRKDALFFLFFFLAILTKETSIFLVILFLLRYFKSHKRGIALAGLVIVAYVLFQLFFFDTASMLSSQSSRLDLYDFNFENDRMTLESIVSFLIISIIGIVLSLGTQRTFKWQKSFFIILILNTSAVFYFAYARESRLFALPLLLFWPYSGLLIQNMVKQFAAVMKRIRPIQILPLLLAAVGYYLSYTYLKDHYQTSITPLDHTVNWQYLSVLMPLVFVIIYMKLALAFAKFPNQ